MRSDVNSDSKKLIGNYVRVLGKVEDAQTCLTVCQNLYQLIDSVYYEEDVSFQKLICHVIDDKVLPACERHMTGSKGAKLRTALYEVYMELYALSARRCLKNFAFFFEFFRTKKVWTKTMRALLPAFVYADDFIAKDLDLMRLSCPPGYGKSYFLNLTAANIVGNDTNASILRITFSEDLVKITTKQTKAIINSEAFRLVFPWAREYEGDKIFRSETQFSFCLANCEDEFNLFAVTRDGQATGKRAKYLLLDDLLKGEIEANDIDLQKRLVNRFDSDWTSRADDDEQKVLIAGTMWSPSDLLNVVEIRTGQLVDDANHRFTRKSLDGYEIYISIPALDENDESTCPARYSTHFFRKKRELMDEFLWSAEYQQNPKAALSRAFDYDSLKQYDEIGRMSEYSRKAVLDPARKGKNYVAMPVFYEKDGLHYLVDFLYKKKTMKELYGEIVDMIIKHQLKRLTLENNTDTSLKEVLDGMLKVRGYFSCTIDEIYSSKKKEIKIMDAKAAIHSYLYFPRKGKYPITTDIGKAMEEIDYYSFDFPNKYDDAIDSVSMYCDCYVENNLNFPAVGTFRR